VGDLGGYGPESLEFFFLDHKAFEFHPVGDVHGDAFHQGGLSRSRRQGRGHGRDQGLDGGAIFVHQPALLGPGPVVVTGAVEAGAKAFPVVGMDPGQEPTRRGHGFFAGIAEHGAAVFVDEFQLVVRAQDKDQQRQILDQGDVAGLGPVHGLGQPGPVQDRGQGMFHQIETDNGFFQVVGRAHAKGPDDAGDFVLAGNDDDRWGVFVLGQGGQDLETVDLGQAQIEQHGFGPGFSGQGQPLTTVDRFQGRIAGTGQPQAQTAPEIRVVFDDQNGWARMGHGQAPG